LAATGALDEALEGLERAAKADKHAAWPLVTRADLLLRGEAPQVDEAMFALKEAARRAKKDDETLADIAWLEGVALLALEEDTRALERFDAALELAEDHVDALLDRGLLLFELGQFDAASEDLENFTQPPFESADAWHTLGLIAERRGDDAAAKKALATARRLEPEAYPAPTGMSEADFDAVVHDALARLPDEARAAMDSVLVTVEPFPSDDDLDGGAHSPTLLGLFKPQPQGAKAQIVLFQKNLERATRTRDELIEQIGITVAHEVGHLLGLDEDQLKDRGLD
jgi:predicted Zn-dependent protease with MMP-like domain